MGVVIVIVIIIIIRSSRLKGCKIGGTGRSGRLGGPGWPGRQPDARARARDTKPSSSKLQNGLLGGFGKQLGKILANWRPLPVRNSWGDEYPRAGWSERKNMHY